jgi:hypothetical protein
MKIQPGILLIVALFASATGTRAATLLAAGATQVEYTLGENGLDYASTFADASGHNRNMTGGWWGANSWVSGPLVPGGSASQMIVDGNSAWVMDNAAGISADYQVTIFLAASADWPTVGIGSSPQMIFSMDGVSFAREGQTYTGSVNANTVGSFAASNWQNVGLKFQKVNGVFSFWASTDSGASWAQYGSDLNNAGAGNNWSITHLFVKPGGGSNYYGYADDFKVVAVVPEPGACLLAGFGLTAMLRRRRS